MPVYDHELAIAGTVSSVRACGLPLILVDDGSGEPCARELRRIAAADPGVSLVRLAANQGKGAAVMAGLQAALDAGYTHALQIDADGTARFRRRAEIHRRGGARSRARLSAANRCSMHPFRAAVCTCGT